MCAFFENTFDSWQSVVHFYMPLWICRKLRNKINARLGCIVQRHVNHTEEGIRPATVLLQGP